MIDLAGDDNLEEEEGVMVKLAGDENPEGVINVLEEEQGVRVGFGFSTRWANNSAPSFDL